jgi:hypothetical protein
MDPTITIAAITTTGIATDKGDDRVVGFVGT